MPRTLIDELIDVFAERVAHYLAEKIGPQSGPATTAPETPVASAPANTGKRGPGRPRGSSTKSETPAAPPAPSAPAETPAAPPAAPAATTPPPAPPSAPAPGNDVVAAAELDKARQALREFAKRTSHGDAVKILQRFAKSMNELTLDKVPQVLAAVAAATAELESTETDALA